MRIRIDESGQFDFRNTAERLAIGVIAAVIIPDQRWPAVEAFVAERKLAWGMPHELKAVDMDETQLFEMAEFMVAQDLTVVGICTDSSIFTAASQRTWRERQVEQFREAAERSRRAIEHPQTRDRVNRLRTRMHSHRHVKQPNYLQYGILMPWLLSRAISASLLCYRRLSHMADSWTLDVAVDPRTGADPGKAGELLRDSVEAIFAGDDRTALLMPGEWSDDHPFKVKNTDPEVPTISARQVLAKGIRTPQSHNDVGLQLADFAAHVLYTALRDVIDNRALAAWRTLQPAVMRTNDDRPIMVWAWTDGEFRPEDQRRYERLAWSHA